MEEINAYLRAKGLPTNYSVAFDDVALGDEYSEIKSRSEIQDFETELAPGLKLGIPIILANMECVAGGRRGAQAIVAVEREGGLGIPPPMTPIDERLMMLELIGRTDCAYIDDPLTISPAKTLRQAKALMEQYGMYSLVVIEDGKPIGILSTRDWRYESDEEKTVGELMGGRRALYVAKKDTSFEEAARILRKHRIEKLPLVNKKGGLAGLLTAHGLFYKHHHPRATRDGKGRFLKVGSIGVGRKFGKQLLYEVEAQVKTGICLLLIDTARAFSVNTKNTLEGVKKHFPHLPIMAGNTCVPEGAKFLFEHGADIVKVGIGPGNVCTTRLTGIGLPQLSAVAKCAAIAKMDRSGRRKIVADGGFRSPADVIKALIAGADAIMSGLLFIGTEEAAAEPFSVELKTDFIEGEVKVKQYEGSASFQAQLKRFKRGDLDRIRRPEGKVKLVPVTCTVKEKIADILDGMRSAMSYLGARSVKELREKAKFELQTRAGLIEGIKKN